MVTTPFDSTRTDWLALHLAPGLGVGGFWRLVRALGSPTEVLQATPETLLSVAGIRQSQVSGLGDTDALRLLARGEIESLHRAGGIFVAFDDDNYPLLLRQLVDPPPLFFLRGNPSLLAKPAIAIVGSRAATGYGRKVAGILAEGLAAAGVVVVSGMALGIDSSAHVGALRGEGSTIAVLGSGLDVTYPQQNKQLCRDIVAKGAVISEYPLGTRPDAFRFPARNRIIAGMSSGIVVVEAARRSGSLITAQIGLDYGRDIFAVPGQIDSFKSEGTHWLLQEGAKLVQHVDDILIELELRKALPKIADPAQDKVTGYTADDPGSDEAHLLAVIEPYPQPRDQIIERAGLDAARVSELLLVLELAGVVEVLPGDRVKRA